MDTLVIHPFDPTTAFLSTIYADMKWTVLSENVSKKVLKEQIKAHQRIILMGHGSNMGLFGHGRLFIDSKLVYLLREKECICIWCNANEFVSRYELKGFYTGMIISDFEEALLYCIKCTADDIDSSNRLFAEIVRAAIFTENCEAMASMIKKLYHRDDNPVILFNKENIFNT